jgi:Rrf2 family protein
VISRTAGYALNAVLYIAAGDPPVSTSAIARALEVPPDYLAKILGTLAQEGVLVSERGRRGGFSLARPPEAIPLLDVVRWFDGMGAERQCLLGRGTCTDAGGCPVHHAWREASTPAFRFFKECSVADVLLGRSTPAPPRVSG